MNGAIVNACILKRRNRKYTLRYALNSPYHMVVCSHGNRRGLFLVIIPTRESMGADDVTNRKPIRCALFVRLRSSTRNS